MQVVLAGHPAAGWNSLRFFSSAEVDAAYWLGPWLGLSASPLHATGGFLTAWRPGSKSQSSKNKVVAPDSFRPQLGSLIASFLPFSHA